MDISTATARVVQDLLKAIVILLDKTVRRSAVDRECMRRSRGNLNFFGLCILQVLPGDDLIKVRRFFTFIKVFPAKRAFKWNICRQVFEVM